MVCCQLLDRFRWKRLHVSCTIPNAVTISFGPFSPPSTSFPLHDFLREEGNKRALILVLGVGICLRTFFQGSKRKNRMPHGKGRSHHGAISGFARHFPVFCCFDYDHALRRPVWPKLLGFLLFLLLVVLTAHIRQFVAVRCMSCRSNRRRLRFADVAVARHRGWSTGSDI